MRPWVMAAVSAAGMMLCGASAAEAQRRIDVPATARWQHARSGVILPTAIGDYRRVGIVDTTQNEVDVAAHYEADGGRITVILFRPQVPDIGLWFDMAERVLRSNPTLADVTPTSAAPVLVTPAGLDVASGLRRSYTSSGPMHTTAMAMMPVGRWILKVRISSPNADAAAIDALMDAALASVRLPEGRVNGQAARVVMPCTAPVNWRRARALVPDLTTALLSGTLQMMLQGNPPPDDATAAAAAAGSVDDAAEAAIAATGGQAEAAGAPEDGEDATRADHLSADVCRDATVLPDIKQVYRSPADGARYWVAFSDSGHLIEVAPAFSLSGGDDQSEIIYLSPQETLVFGRYNRLPTPEQVIDTLTHGRPAVGINYDPEIPDANRELRILTM